MRPIPRLHVLVAHALPDPGYRVPLHGVSFGVPQAAGVSFYLSSEETMEEQDAGAVAWPVDHVIPSSVLRPGLRVVITAGSMILVTLPPSESDHA